MFSFCSILLLFAAIVFAWSPPVCLAKEAAEDAALGEEALELINDAVYEVVAKKPTRDSLSYEKPLPLDLLPYSIRNDKYYSIGTAFAIGPERFVSAAHVMNLDVFESQFVEVYLRDTGGKVYEIKEIMGFSDHRDFVVFSLKGKKADRYFDINRNMKLNQRIYAVGNALGQGIILRDGLYTSNTPEEINGEWNWMRFSAAASPGNSGGPLLDSEGRVVGIVLGKSENENLNYALPITEALDAKNGTGVSYKKVKYVLENMDMTKHATFEKEVSLPKPYRDLKHELTEGFSEFTGPLLQDFLAENKDGIFPNGDGSKILLHNTYSAVFPHMIMKDSDGMWSVYYPSETTTAELGDNGYMDFGSIGDSLFVYLQKPDDVSMKKLFSDSRLFMDLMLRGLYLYRPVASEKIKITSCGKAHEDYVHEDTYGRKWFVKTWLLEYSDEKIVVFALPVPGGFAALIKMGQTGLVNNGYIPDLKVLTDFMYVSYYGTLKQWKEFLALKDKLPGVFATIKTDFNYGRKVGYSSDRMEFSYTPEAMDITEDSDMNLLFGYFKDGGKTVWDVKAVVVGEDKNTKTSFGVYRKNRPVKGLRDNYQSEWEDVVKRRFPYNASAYFNDGNTLISALFVKMGADMSAEEAGKAPFLYTVTYQAEGNVEQGEMVDRLKKFNESLTIHEAPKGDEKQYTQKRGAK